VTILHESSLILGELQSMNARNVVLFGITLDMGLDGDLICTTQLRKLAALELYVLFVINFFAIHQNMEPA
jgi:hypothetical protein